MLARQTAGRLASLTSSFQHHQSSATANRSCQPSPTVAAALTKTPALSAAAAVAFLSTSQSLHFQPLRPMRNRSSSVWLSSCSSSTSYAAFFEATTRGFSSKSLADEIMSAKVAEAQGSKDEKAAASKAEQPEAGGGGGQQEGGGEEGPKKGPKPLSKWQRIGYWAFGILMSGTLVANAVIFALPETDEKGENIRDEFSDLPFPSQYYKRLKNKFFKTKKEMEEPFSDKLLPDPLPEPYHQPKYTILIELTGLLIHSNWTHKHGWRFQKRPGVDMFLTQIGYPHFELVVYTTENPMTFYPIIDGLDSSQQYIMYRLFRDATRYVDGHHKKDLTALNRDLSKVIVVDWNENVVDCNRENALLLKKWEGDNTDRSLIGLAQLLQAIRESDVEDVRDVLRYYKQFEDPIEAFRENQRKLQDEMAALEEKQQMEAKSKTTSFFSAFSRR